MVEDNKEEYIKQILAAGLSEKSAQKIIAKLKKEMPEKAEELYNRKLAEQEGTLLSSPRFTSPS